MVGVHAHQHSAVPRSGPISMSKLQQVSCGTQRHSRLRPKRTFACLVVRGASTVEVAVNGVHLEGVGGPLTLHGGLHIVVAVEGDSALLVVTAKASYDHRVLILHWPADFDLSACSTALPLTNIIDKPLSR